MQTNILNEKVFVLKVILHYMHRKVIIHADTLGTVSLFTKIVAWSYHSQKPSTENQISRRPFPPRLAFPPDNTELLSITFIAGSTPLLSCNILTFSSSSSLQTRRDKE